MHERNSSMANIVKRMLRGDSSTSTETNPTRYRGSTSYTQYSESVEDHQALVSINIHPAVPVSIGRILEANYTLRMPYEEQVTTTSLAG